MVQYFPIVTGSLTVTGSVNVSGSITTNSTITATTLVVQTITSSISFVTGSTKFGAISSNTHQFTGSLNVTGALYVATGSVGIGTVSPSQLFEVVGGEIKAGRVDTSQEGGQVSFGRSTDNATAWYIDAYGSTSSPILRFVDVTGAAVRMVISGSNVGIGTSNPDALLRIDTNVASTANNMLYLYNADFTSTTRTFIRIRNNISAGSTYSTYIGQGVDKKTYIIANDTSRNDFVINGDDGYIGIGTKNPSSKVTIIRDSPFNTGDQGLRIKANDGDGYNLWMGASSNGYATIQSYQDEVGGKPLLLNPLNNGKVLINTSDSGPNAQLISSGDQNDPYPIGAKAESASQGLIAFFNNGNGVEGNISIASGVVSYNSFMGSHWSQLSDNSKPEILKGTILEAIDELCQWDEENNDRLAKIKISDTIGSKNVYGVFLDWDNTDEFNDMYVASLGASYIRINTNQNVSMGDLLQSNGDGTAKIQSDDIMRSSTIAKVVSTNKIETYEDGSYLVAATLHCG
jgi:hypothetical protein